MYVNDLLSEQAVGQLTIDDGLLQIISHEKAEKRKSKIRVPIHGVFKSFRHSTPIVDWLRYSDGATCLIGRFPKRAGQHRLQFSAGRLRLRTGEKHGFVSRSRQASGELGSTRGRF